MCIKKTVFIMSIFRVSIQPTSKWCLKCQLQYPETVEYFILKIMFKWIRNKEKPFPFIFFTSLTIFILFEEKMTTLTLKPHKLFI